MLIAAVIFTLAGPSVDAPPFTQMKPQADYSSIMAEKSHGRDNGSRVVTHHGRWTRIERTNGPYPTSEYYSATSGARMTVSHQRSIALQRSIDPTPGIDLQARNTGERQTHLAESCTVWNLWQTPQPVDGANVSYQSCITDDGITLWEKTLHGNVVLSSVEASRIERRPIAPEEVQPPRALLALDWWDMDLPSFNTLSTPDHETIMELSGASSEAAKSIRTTRRLGPWQFRDETFGSRRWIAITHDSLWLQFSYASDGSGASTQLSITRPDTISASSALKTASQMTDLHRSERVLGESCHWVDMLPGIASADHRSCLTSDGIVLKDVFSGRGMSEQEWTAVRMTRRPILLDEIKPPAELLDPHLWGLD